MKRIRVATEEEVNAIRAESDLDPTCIVLALDTQLGVPKAVVRTAVEVDPAFYPKEFSAKQIALFTRDVETFLSAKGVLSYYFNIDSSDEEWIKTVKAWGAEQVSPVPQLRFKVTL